MKLYSRSQMVKSSLISLAAGVVLTLSATAYISFQQKERERAEESEELASAKEE